jgi:3-oxoacyl-[acyl-carrier protein] reductase
MFDLTGKCAIVTGGNTGIGKAITLCLANAGAKVVATYFSSEFSDDELSSAGVLGLKLDATDSNEVEIVISEAANKLGGKVDILVNNAGGLLGRVHVEEMSDEFFQSVNDVNYASAFFCIRAVLPSMPDGGRIINIGSLAAQNGGGNGSVIYASAKAALVGLTKGLAKELAPRKITVNLIAPGFIIDTPFHEQYTPEQVMETVIQNTPLKRPGIPDDISPAVQYLASDAGGFVTGEVLSINGGLYFS